MGSSRIWIESILTSRSVSTVFGRSTCDRDLTYLCYWCYRWYPRTRRVSYTQKLPRWKSKRATSYHDGNSYALLMHEWSLEAIGREVTGLYRSKDSCEGRSKYLQLNSNLRPYCSGTKPWYFYLGLELQKEASNVRIVLTFIMHAIHLPDYHFS